MLLVPNYKGKLVEVPEQPLFVRDVGGCICPGLEAKMIDPECAYHRAAAQQPWNHCIPWNCATFWDGCNCEDGPYFVEK